MNIKQQLKKLIIESSASIREAISAIDNNAKGILFVVDRKEKIRGVVTDGDIRRGLLKDIQLDNSIKLVMNQKFIAFTKDTPYSTIANKIGNKYKYIPILDANKKIIDYYSFSIIVKIPVARPSLSGNESKYLLECVATNWISSQGKFVNRFEKEFANFIGCKYGISTSNGTAALHLALEALGIGKNDEVIVPALTFIATANAVTFAGAKVIFADSEKDTWNLDPEKIEKKISEKTKAIIPVHLYGQPAKIEQIKKIAQKYNLYVIEDAAEAHGAQFKNQRVGSFGDIGVFSFYGNKVITTGEGGMLITNNKKIGQKAKILRDHGMDPGKKYWHSDIGYNYRMTNMQAAVGCAQLERIDKIILKKQQIAEQYRKILCKFDNVILRFLYIS